MPHLVLRGAFDAGRVARELEPGVSRWGRAVLKIGDRWLRDDGRAVLVEGVVVELARPLHPVAMVADRDGATVVRLWPAIEIERTAAVQRWLAIVALGLQRLGAGAVRTTNIPPEILDGLALAIDLD
ncbi:MAG: hypothetical protein MUC56_03620 [Thermoanaerobaculales bacterium]|jgi:hypothetical protein|nr:hypothetical protein [Thermoanaerobaculales bacterium]